MVVLEKQLNTVMKMEHVWIMVEVVDVVFANVMLLLLKNMLDYLINITWNGVISMVILLKKINAFDTVVEVTENQNVAEMQKEHQISFCIMPMPKYAAMMVQLNQMVTSVISIPLQLLLYQRILLQLKHQGPLHQLTNHQVAINLSISHIHHNF